MKKVSDAFIGRRFGRLTVVRFDEDGSIPHKQRWICRCDCGKEKSILRNNLTQGGVESCGCLKSEVAHRKQTPSNRTPQDITGFVSGSLTVLEMIPNTHPPKCRCKCECGNESVVDARRIRSQSIKSCGCGMSKLRKSLVNRRFGKLVVVKREENYKSPVSGQEKVQYRCSCDCGGEIVVHASALISGMTKSCGCIRSIAEMKLESLLAENHIPFKREYRFDDCVDKRQLPFDFAIIDDKDQPIFLIELDGIQHYESANGRNVEYTQRHDKIKTQYCANRNIPLLRVPYWEFGDMERNVLKEIKKHVFENQYEFAERSIPK